MCTDAAEGASIWQLQSAFMENQSPGRKVEAFLMQVVQKKAKVFSRNEQQNAVFQGIPVRPYDLYYLMAHKNKERFEIAPSDQVQVGTEILDPNLPSNLDFDQPAHKSIEMVDMKPKQLKEEPLGKVDLENFDIRSYIIKGKVVFNLQPQHKPSDILPADTATFPVKCYNDEYSSGLKRIWQALVGYTNRQLYINQGYIYLLQRQKTGLVVVSLWKLVSLFKIFIDYEESKLRLVLKQQGEHLQHRDYSSPQIKQLLQRLSQQLNSIGLSLLG